MTGGSGLERPDLKHLVSAEEIGLPVGNYFCVMPSAQWQGKRWPVDRFLEVIRGSGICAVVLGAAGDQASVELVSKLKESETPHFSGVGAWTLPQVATVLSRSRGYLGNDTGLAHLAEAVGVPAWMIFGPTSPAMGFGPWRKESRAFETQLACHPCGKDGRACVRFSRYECLRTIDPKAIAGEVVRSWIR